jgi:hypothetical protein
MKGGRKDRGSVKESLAGVMIKMCGGKWTHEEILIIELERS